MMLNMFENMLQNIANDKALMSYGNNNAVVNNLMSVISLIKTLQSTLQSGGNDMFAMTLMNKVAELENFVVMLGGQRLMACGINTGGMMGGMMQPFSPLMASQPMYNQQMNFPSMMMQPMMQPMMQQQFQPQMQPQPMMQPQFQPQMQQQPMMQPQSPAPQPMTSAPAPTPMSAPAPSVPAPTPKSSEPAIDAAKKPSSSGGGGGGGFDLGAMIGGDDKPAAGRDYLLKLLSEK